MRLSIACTAPAAAGLAAGLLAAVSASADTPPAASAPSGEFQAALSEYRAGHYDSAHAQFLSLAELGDCSAQFNLAAMALHGQGGQKDPGSGVGWLEAAAGNGCGQLVGNRVAGLTPKLTAEEARAAAAIVARYGPQALHAQGVVNPELSCRDTVPASVLSATRADIPAAARGKHEPALVIAALTVGADGHASDPEVLLALGPQGFAGAAVEAWLNSQFTPAQRDARAVAARLEEKTLFADGESLASSEAVRRGRSAADAGDPAAGYQIGLIAMLDPALGISAARGEQLLLDAARDGNADAQYWVGSQLRASAACHPQADGAVWLRHAAAGGSAAAQLLLARELLGSAADAANLTRARTLLAQAARADSYYVRKHVVALLASSPLDEVRDPPKALELARQLDAAEIRADPQMYEAVAAAYAANGSFRDATAQQQLATDKARTLGWNTRTMSERLDAYRHGKAWRGDLLGTR
jgi:TPR repeat protein